ncbi:MAG TPA: flagellar FlbD family protein [Pseudogracilibacillus sp.]|nr:flagellar FlbD family protein [Pseudogracilibacillus sp.]
MIELEKVDGDRFTLNALFIEQIQSFPDTTTITLTNGKKIVVKTKRSEVVEKVTDYYQQIGLSGSVQEQVID